MARSRFRGRLFSWYDLANPGIISIPLGFIACWLGTVLSKQEVEERTFDELYVRSETGLGAEVGTGLTLTGRADGNGSGTREDTEELVGGPQR